MAAEPAPWAGEPRGAFDTGTFEELWIDQSRDDPSTADPDDRRKVMVQVWYPAGPSKRGRLAPYAISPELYAKDHWARERWRTQTRSVLDAPLVAEPKSFPVLIYNHGGLYPHFSATFQTEFLASHGYIVVAIGHPGSNEIQRFPDGTTYKNDGKQWMVQPPNARQLPARERWEDSWIKSDIGLLVQDVSFVLDRLTQLNSTPKHRLQRRLDLDRVGALGWSLGGMVSLQAARDDSRIKAAANLDGWPFGLLGPKGVVTLGSEKPVLLMFASGSDWGQVPANFSGTVDAGELEAGSLATTQYWAMLRRTPADWYHVTIARTTHSHFSDDLLFQEQDPQLMPPRVAHEIINDYSLAFFDKYVKGHGEDTALLLGQRSFPEVRMLRGK